MQGEYKQHAAKGFKPFPSKKRIHRMIPRIVPRSAQSKWQHNVALLGVALLSSVAMMSFTCGFRVHHRRLPGGSDTHQASSHGGVDGSTRSGSLPPIRVEPPPPMHNWVGRDAKIESVDEEKNKELIGKVVRILEDFGNGELEARFPGRGVLTCHKRQFTLLPRISHVTIANETKAENLEPMKRTSIDGSLAEENLKLRCQLEACGKEKEMFAQELRKEKEAFAEKHGKLQKANYAFTKEHETFQNFLFKAKAEFAKERKTLRTAKAAFEQEHKTLQAEKAAFEKERETLQEKNGMFAKDLETARANIEKRKTDNWNACAELVRHLEEDTNAEPGDVKTLVNNWDACKTLWNFLARPSNDLWDKKRKGCINGFKAVPFNIGDWVIAPRSGAKTRDIRHFKKRVPGKIVGIKITKKGEIRYKILWRKVGSFEDFEIKAVPYTKLYKLTKIEEKDDDLQTKWGKRAYRACYTGDSSLAELRQKYKIREIWHALGTELKSNSESINAEVRKRLPSPRYDSIACALEVGTKVTMVKTKNGVRIDNANDIKVSPPVEINFAKDDWKDYFQPLDTKEKLARDIDCYEKAIEKIGEIVWKGNRSYGDERTRCRNAVQENKIKLKYMKYSIEKKLQNIIGNELKQVHPDGNETLVTEKVRLIDDFKNSIAALEKEQDEFKKNNSALTNFKNKLPGFKQKETSEYKERMNQLKNYLNDLNSTTRRRRLATMDRLLKEIRRAQNA